MERGGGAKATIPRGTGRREKTLKKLHPMAHTHKHTHAHTDGHDYLETELAQWADSVKTDVLSGSHKLKGG